MNFLFFSGENLLLKAFLGFNYGGPPTTFLTTTQEKELIKAHKEKLFLRLIGVYCLFCGVLGFPTLLDFRCPGRIGS